MKQINFFILVLFISTANAQQKDESLLISYTGQFNSLFGRGEEFRPYQAWLHIKGDQSLFTMKPLHSNAEQNNMMTVDLPIDSLFTVYKDIESNSLLFEFMDLDQRSHFYADTLYPMNWVITNEKKISMVLIVSKQSLYSKGANTLLGTIRWFRFPMVLGNLEVFLV
jgi:hypothetical protein